MSPSSHPVICFAEFELDLLARELRKNGIKVKLQNQPFLILQMLLERPGEVVTREEIRNRIWPADEFVDFEHSVNTAVKKLRQALGDRAGRPVFIETLPRQGFRFIAELRRPAGAPAEAVPARKPPRLPRLAVAGAAALCVVAGALVVFPRMTRLSPQAHSPHTMRSIAVLPLVNLSPDPQQEYFSDGMTSELITDLAKLSSLRVISHTSVKRYKNAERRLPEMAAELGVDAVVEGTVTRSGNRVRIAAQLIDARSDHHIWADSFERDAGDILSLQAELAQQIANEVGIHLTASEQARLAGYRPVDPAAHEAYLKGLFYWNRLNCEGFQRGLKYFQEALARDPNFVPAYCGVADAYFNLADWGCMAQKEAFAESKAAALKAQQLDPGSADAHGLLGELAFYNEWDWPKAEKEFRQAVELDANAAGSRGSYAIFLVAMGRQEQALAEMKQALQLDPVSEMTNVMSAYLFYLIHQYDKAIAQAKKTLELFPRSGAAYYWLGQCYEKQGLEKEAVAAYLSPPPAGDAKPNQIEAWRSRLQQSLRGYWQQQLDKELGKKREPACWQTHISAHLGDKERTLQLLEWGYQHHCDGLQFLKVEPIYDNLRGDTRYNKLLSRLGL